jgi:hypothetical protein
LTAIGKALPSRNHSRAGAAFLIGAALSAVCLGTGGCRVYRPNVHPPAEIRTIEGYASFRLTRGGNTARMKFAFALALPDQARLEVFDALGRSASTFLIRGDEAYLVLPSEKAYWRGGRDEVIEKFLGFPVQPAEIAGLLTGRWGGEAVRLWSFERDARGRAVSGIRGGLSFRILEFFPGGDLPRRWSFRSSETDGVVGLLDAAFDRPAADFSTAFLRTYASKTWAEIERLLR